MSGYRLLRFFKCRTFSWNAVKVSSTLISCGAEQPGHPVDAGRRMSPARTGHRRHVPPQAERHLPGTSALGDSAPAAKGQHDRSHPAL